MDGSSAKKSTSLESLVIQNITNIQELKAKLNEIVTAGKDYEYDVSACIKSLLNSSDGEIVLLSVQAVAELSKCQEKRQDYAKKDIVQPILNHINKGFTSNRPELVKHSCRALGNLCCDCDIGRKAILDCNGIPLLLDLLKKAVEDLSLEELKLLVCKTLLNFTIGGLQMCEAVQTEIPDLIRRILVTELNKEDMDDNIVTNAIMILSVINDNSPDYLFSSEVNCAVLRVLKDTANIEISELCLDHLHLQAEHDSVKTLLAREGGLQLVCARLELLMERQAAGELTADDSEVDAVVKQACDLIIIVLTGDEAMHLLYNNGLGEVYRTMVKWLDSTNHQLLSTGVLAVGNFARKDEYCQQMIDANIFEKLLDIFETYLNFDLRMKNNPTDVYPIDETTVTNIQHAVASAIRNLSVPGLKGHSGAKRAAGLLLKALPGVKHNHLAYKLLAAMRMLLSQESVARQLASDKEALRAVARWGGCGEHAGAAGEAPRLLAWCIKQPRRSDTWQYILEVEGCITCLVNMLISSHSIMQNEAILALTLLAIESLKATSPQPEPPYDYEKAFIQQLIKSEIGKHISVLIDTNCAKLPVEVAENLMAFLDITSKKNEIALDYRENKVDEALVKFKESRKELSEDFKSCIGGVVTAIVDNVTDK